MKHKLLFPVALICVCIVACAGKLRQVPEYFTYLLQVQSLSQPTYYNGNRASVIFQDSTAQYLTYFKDTAVRFVNIATDSVEKEVILPFRLKHLNSYYATDTSHIAFFADTFFLIYQNGKFKKYNLSLFSSDYFPVNYGNAYIKLTNLQSNNTWEYPIASGDQSVELNTSVLPVGSYVYALLIDGKLIDSKKMTIIKN